MKRWLIISVSLNLLIILTIIGKRIYYSTYGSPSPSFDITAYMAAINEIQESLPIDTGDIVFVGTSLTANFPLNEIFNTTKIKNRGIASNQLTHISDRISCITDARPKVIYLEAGINDLEQGVPAMVTADRYKYLIDKIDSLSPGTNVIVQSTLPVCYGYLHLMNKVDSLNNLIKEYCSKKGIMYLDIGSTLRKGPSLDTSYTWDGVHLNAAGYRMWAEALRSSVLR